MCRPIFLSGTDLVLEIGFCVANGIRELKDKGVNAGYLTKKRRYYPKEFPRELIDNNFEDKELGDVVMLET